MYSHLKDTVKKMLLYGLGDGLNKVVGFIMIPLYTAYLTPRDYGIIALLDIVVGVMGLFLQAGVNATIFRFYYEYDELGQKELISTAMMALPTIAFIVLLSTCFFSRYFAVWLFDNTQYSTLFIVIFITIWFHCFVKVFSSHILAQQKSIFFNIFSTVRLLVGLTLNIYFLVFLKIGFIGILYSELISTGITAFFGTTYTFLRVGFKFSKNKLLLMYKFGLPLIPSAFANTINSSLDRFFLNKFISTSDVGIYSLGYKFGSIISNIITQPFMRIWGIKRFQIYQEEESPSKLFAKAYTYFVAFIVFISLFIAININEILAIMADEKYHGAAVVVPIILTAYIIRASYYHFNIGIYIEKKTKYMSYMSFILLPTNIALNILLIPRYGMVGAAIVNVISFLIHVSLVLLISQRLYHVPFEWDRIARILLVAAAIYSIAKCVMHSDNICVTIIVKNIVLGLYPVLLYFMKVFEKAEIRKSLDMFLPFTNRILSRRAS